MDQNVFIEEPGVILEDVDFCDTHMVLTLRQGRKLRLCAINLPLTEGINVSELFVLICEATIWRNFIIS